jgi:indole-3-acetate monooxygenase
MSVGDRYERRTTEIVDRVREVVAAAGGRAEETERLGRIPADLYDDLEATGFFQSLVPRRYGGPELPLAAVSEMVIEGARADGAIGWVMMVAVVQPVILSMFPEKTVADVIGAHPRARIRGTLIPKGRAVAVDGGYLVSGQWPFASGGPNPDFVTGNCIVVEGDGPRRGPTGQTETVVVLLPADQVTFLDTWHVMGMQGTDSCDFTVADLFVPHEMTTSLLSASSSFDTPASCVPLRVMMAPGHASVAVGIARGALDDITELGQTKRFAFRPSSKLGDDIVFRHGLGENVLRFEAAHALLQRVTAEVDAAGPADAWSPRQVLIGRTMAGYVASECVKIVDFAYASAGSVSVYESSDLQRRFRDIHVAAQHVSQTSESYRVLGAAVLGKEVSALELL